MLRSLFITCILVALWAGSLCAQTQRVGVVLSGGGAKGVAHVGVLKALEEHGIPIDYMAGTSMGAIIGGMYAAGFSPDSIETIVTSGEFQKWALGIIDEEYNFFYKRPCPDPSWIGLRFTTDSVWQPRLPTSLVSPVQMDFAGMKYFSGANMVSEGDFDRLFVPFRCVAADIKNKEAVVFRSGDIYRSIRASMTYPFVYRPIRIDGVLLFDGGIYNNFPVDVMATDFAPDLIVGSAVSANFPPPTEDDIRSHIENLLVSQTVYEVPEEQGVLIRPALPETGVTDFSRAHDFVDSGYVATIRVLDELKQRFVNRVSPEEVHQRRQAFLDKKPPLLIDRIFFSGLNHAQEDYMHRLLLERGRPLTIDEIRDQYFKLLAEEHIESIDPRLSFNPLSGYYDLHLDIRTDYHLLVQFGGNISSSPVNFAFLSARYKRLGYQAYTAELLTYLGRFNSSIELRGRMDVPFDMPFFVETRGSFNYYDYFSSATSFFQDRTPSFLQQNESYWQLALGVAEGNDGRILLDLTAGSNRDDYYQTNVFGRSDTTDQTRFRYYSPSLRFERNSLNRKQFPDNGSRLLLTLRHVSGVEIHRPGSTSPHVLGSRTNHSWWQFRVTHQHFFPRENNHRLGTFSELFVSNKNLFSNYTSSLLSAQAFEHVPETRTLFLPRYRANNYMVVGVKGIYYLADNLEARLDAYIFQPLREIRADAENIAYYSGVFERRYALLSAVMVYHTPLGPISLSAHYYDRHDDPFSFRVNIGYLIFNRRALR